MLSSGNPSRDNPFVADDRLIKVGVLATIVSVGFMTFVDSDLRPVFSLAITLSVLGAGIAALGAGLVLRSRERKALRLLGLVERFPEISVAELVGGSRWKRADIERAVATVNERGLHYVVWDRDTDTLVDGRLATGSVVVDDCADCGANIGLRVSLADPSAAACPYCRSGVPAAAIDALKRSRLSALDAERAHEREQRARHVESVAVAAASPKERARFSVGLFLLLLFLAAPLGLGYGVYGAWRAVRR